MTIAVVTGGAGDIGMAICRALGAAGHAVAVVDLTPQLCDGAVARLEAAGVIAFAAPCDITDATAVAAMAAAVTARGEVAVVVNNAGRASAPNFETTSEADWMQSQALNLNGAYFVTRNLLPAMQARRHGVVVNIASVNGAGNYGNPAYSVAKAGLLHFTRMLAVEYGPFGIRAVSILPGSVRTQLWNDRLAVNPGVIDDIARFYPLRRIALPEDVANAVAFVASDAAAAITGSEIVVDCGLLAGNTLMAETITKGDR